VEHARDLSGNSDFAVDGVVVAAALGVCVRARWTPYVAHALSVPRRDSSRRLACLDTIVETADKIVRATVILVTLLYATTLHAANYYVVVAGLGGSPEYETQFEKWASELDHELRANGPDAHVTALSGNAVSRQELQRLINDLSTTVQADDSFSLMLIGHGSFDGTDYKFNIPGPDVTAAELAAWMNRIPATRQLVVNMTSCSGASVQPFARRNRIVITATKSGTERNATVFPRYWVDSLRDPAADTDKNGTVSALEAFRYTEHKLTAYFDEQKLLASEHPLFTDNGSPNATRDPNQESGQGRLAAAFPLLRPQTETAAAANPAKQRLLTKKQELEAKIDKLKYEKAALSEQEYKQQLGALLLELAKTQAEIDR
jgi:hypothetical protein